MVFEDLRKQVKNNKGISNQNKKKMIEIIDKEELDFLIRTAPTDIKRLIYDFIDDKQYEKLLKKRKEKELDSLIRTAPTDIKRLIYNFTGDKQYKKLQFQKLLVSNLESVIKKLDSEKLDEIYSDIKIYKKKFGKDSFIKDFETKIKDWKKSFSYKNRV